MAYKEKKYEVSITSDNKVRFELTPQEHKEMIMRGMPNGLKVISKIKQEKSLDNEDDDTAFGYKRSEVSSEEFEVLRQAEAKERTNNA